MDDLEPRVEPRPASASPNARGEAPAKPDSNPRWRSRVAALLALLLLGGTTLAVLTRRPHNAAIQPTPAAQPTPAETDAPFPSDTASDVVSFSDHVALVTAVTETDAPPTTPAMTTDGERIVMRDITFRVDDVLWSRPTARPAPARFSAKWWGWIMRDGKRTAFIVSGAPVVFLGAQYVVPIVYDRTAFTVVQPFAVFRFNKGSVSLEQQDTPLARDLDSRSLTSVTAVFDDAVPDPLAVQYKDLLPRAKLAAVLTARAGSRRR